MKHQLYICKQSLTSSYKLYLLIQRWKNCADKETGMFESPWTHHSSKIRWEEPTSQKTLSHSDVHPLSAPPSGSHVCQDRRAYICITFSISAWAPLVLQQPRSHLFRCRSTDTAVCDPSSARGRIKSRGTRRAGRASLWVFSGKLAGSLLCCNELTRN